MVIVATVDALSVNTACETDFAENLNAIGVPALVQHGEDDRTVPIGDTALLTINLLIHRTLKTSSGLPHGMCTTHADIINADLLVFVQC